MVFSGGTASLSLWPSPTVQSTYRTVHTPRLNGETICNSDPVLRSYSSFATFQSAQIQ